MNSFAIKADGAWTFRLTQPVPKANAKEVPGKLTGSGPTVPHVQTVDELQPVVTASHRGASNFIVYLIGIGDLTGTILLFNEIGNFDGEELIEEMPAGGYLLAVEADGNWTLRFRR